MIDCVDSSTLRAHLDRPDPELESHVDGCPECSGLLGSVAADAGATRRALSLLDRPDVVGGSSERAVDVEAALRSVLGEADGTTVVPIAPSRSNRFRSARRRVGVAGVAAAVTAVVLVSPGGRDALAGVLDLFRGERLQPVTVDLAEWASSAEPEDLLDLEVLGDVDLGGLDPPERVRDPDEAERVAGIGAPTVDEAPDRLFALAPGTVRLVLVARDGNGVPEELDGAQLIVSVPGAIAAVYGSDDGLPEMIVGRSGRLVVRAEGASLDSIRSFLLSREELPEDLRNQLLAIEDWRSTIPLPVPLGSPGWSETEVAGRPAVTFGDESGLGAVVLRQDPDGVTVVGGRIGVGRAVDIAEGA